MSTVREGWDHWSEASAYKVQTRDHQTVLLLTQLSTIREEGADIDSRPATKRKRIPKSKLRGSAFETDDEEYEILICMV